MTDRRLAFYEQPLAEWTEIAGSKVSARAIVNSGFRMLQLIAEIRLGISSRSQNGASAAIGTVLAVPGQVPAEAA